MFSKIHIGLFFIAINIIFSSCQVIQYAPNVNRTQSRAFLKNGDWANIISAKINEKESTELKTKLTLKKIEYLDDQYLVVTYIGKDVLYNTIAVFDISEKTKLLWYMEEQTEYELFDKNVFFLDFNNDGLQDFCINYYAEGLSKDLFVFCNKPKKAPDSYDKFKYAHSSAGLDMQYLLVDLDNDSIPELMINNPSVEDSCRLSLSLTKKFEKEMEKEFLRISKDFEQIKDDFNPFDFMYAPVGILKYNKGEFELETSQYKEHLEWRKALLAKMRLEATEADKKIIDRIISEMK